MAATVAPAHRPAGAAAPQRRVRPDAQPAPRKLRIVDDARIKAAHRRRRMRLVMFVAGALAVALLFALAAFNAMLVTGQGRLDELERTVSEAQSTYSANRLEVARLESPEHIVEVAQRRLGMRPPTDVGYLAPSEAMAEQAGTRAVQDETVDDGAEGAAGYAAVKPYLNGQP